MKKQYSAPEMEVISLKSEDMILTSGACEECPFDEQCGCDVTGGDYQCNCHGVPGQEK